MIALLAVQAFAQETFTHEDSGLKFTLPAGWTYTHQGDHFEAASADETIILLFFVGNGAEVEEAIDAAVDGMSEVILDPKIVTERTEVQINGLTQVFMEGDGLVDGQPIDWDLTVVRGSRRCMAVVAMGEIENNQKLVDRIYESIRE